MSPEPDEEPITTNVDQVGIELPFVKARLTPKGVDDLVNYGLKWVLMGVTVLFITVKVFDCGEGDEVEPPCVNCGSDPHHKQKQQEK
jgi:hypothetical protein